MIDYNPCCLPPDRTIPHTYWTSSTNIWAMPRCWLSSSARLVFVNNDSPAAAERYLLTNSAAPHVVRGMIMIDMRRGAGDGGDIYKWNRTTTWSVGTACRANQQPRQWQLIQQQKTQSSIKRVYNNYWPNISWLYAMWPLTGITCDCRWLKWETTRSNEHLFASALGSIDVDDDAIKATTLGYLSSPARMPFRCLLLPRCHEISSRHGKCNVRGESAFGWHSVWMTDLYAG